MRVALHACCGPCASACVPRLKDEGHAVTLVFANSNIDTREEFEKRRAEAEKLARADGVPFAALPYDHDDWLREVASGHEGDPEKGERCARCYRYNMSKAAEYAAANGIEAFTTSLTVSPHKPSQAVFAAGRDVAAKTAGGSVSFVEDDFKKREGFKLSVRRAAELGLYRQSYCGCEFSRSAASAPSNRHDLVYYAPEMEKMNSEPRPDAGGSRTPCRGLSLMSGGLDSQLAVRVLQRAGAEVEGVCFSTPFFDCAAAKRAAAALGVKLHVVDFLDDEIALIKNPPHGFGGAMNPCIDCHATMIRRAGEMMERLGFDFVATGEVRGQRPMSQNAQSLVTVEKASGLSGRLVRPLSAKLLEPTIPEKEGLLDRERLLDLSGRGRERQIALAAEFGIVEYPSPAGGCKLTEAGFSRKLRDLMEHEGLDDRRLVELSVVARRFRLPDGTSVMLGRDQRENAILHGEKGVVLFPVNVAGPTALLPRVCSDADMELAKGIVCAYSRFDRVQGDVVLNVGAVQGPYDREAYRGFQVC